MSMFQVGETVIYPGYGAGTVVDIGKLSCLGSDRRYYEIKLQDGSRTQVWVAVNDAGAKGVRRPLVRSRLGEVWLTLCADPQELPSDYNERYAIVREQIENGDASRVAGALRDLSWKDGHVRKLTIEGKRLYDKALSVLSTEVAAIEETDRESVARDIVQRLQESEARPSID